MKAFKKVASDLREGWEIYKTMNEDRVNFSGGPDSDYEGMPIVFEYLWGNGILGEKFEGAPYFHEVNLNKDESRIVTNAMLNLYDEILIDSGIMENGDKEEFCKLFEQMDGVNEGETFVVLGD
ncbi:MAG: hypothetical protein N4A47_03535 [Clostridia bacterium]|nr:hypothetical protein [Clostridia bacterium]